MDETESLLKTYEPKTGIKHVQFYDSVNENIHGKTNNDDGSKTDKPVTAKYWYRWYICIIFAFNGLLQGAVWNTWGPIDQSAECALEFHSSDIDLLTNWGPISFIPSMPLFMWLFANKGLKLPIVSSAFLMALGTGLRCLPLKEDILKYFIHIGQFLNGIAGCTVMAAPPLISNVWFPPNERVTATSITTMFNYFGSILVGHEKMWSLGSSYLGNAANLWKILNCTGTAFILGPLLVQQPTGTGSQNHTGNNTDHLYSANISNICNSTHEKEVIRLHSCIMPEFYPLFFTVIWIFSAADCSPLHEINNLMYVEFGIATAIFLCMLAFFPNKPPQPPSISASTDRMDLKEGLLALRYNRTFLIVVLTVSFILGSYGGWSGVMAVIMTPLGISQDEAGRLGFFMTLSGCGTGMFIGWFADRIKGHIKMLLIILYSICFLAFLYYIIMSQNWIDAAFFEFSHVGLWICCIIIGITMNASAPLGTEMVADSAYPTSEGTSASVLVWCLNIASFILLLVLQFSEPILANYLLLAILGISVLLLIFFTREPTNRLQIDLSIDSNIVI